MLITMWKWKWSRSDVSPTLCHPIDCSLPGSSVHGIFQARILEWVAFLFSRGSSLENSTQGSNPGLLPEKQKDALKIQPPEPHPNPLTQAAGAQESESPLIPRWALAARSSFQTLHLEFPWLLVFLLVSLLLECVIATLNNSFQHSPNVF